MAKKTNPINADPSRTATLRRVFVADVRRRFNRLKRKINKLVIEENAFGIEPTDNQSIIANAVKRDDSRSDDWDLFKNDRSIDNVGNVKRSDVGFYGISNGNNAGFFSGLSDRSAVLNARFSFKSTQKQVEAFERWLATQIQIEIVSEQMKDKYWEEYTKQGYAKGAGRAFDDTRKASLATKAGEDVSAFFAGTRQEFLQSAFGRPEAIAKVKLLASRTFTDLKNVTQVMSTQIRRELVDGLTRGDNPRTIARLITKRVDSIGKVRAEMIARTEIIRAHAEGQLDSMEKLGVERVGVSVEWSTAGDDRVCPRCAELEGVVLKLKEAHGLIPRHPSCVVGESLIECDDALSLMKTHYTGEIIEIVTAYGRRISITPNHILLTQYGLLSANFIHEGFYIAGTIDSKTDTVITPDNDSGKTSIANVFASFAKDASMFSEAMPLSPEYFHGDGKACNSEINIIWPNSKLWDKQILNTCSCFKKAEFPFFQFVGSESQLSTLSSMAFFLYSVAFACDSSMGRFRELLALLLGGLLHANKHRSTSVPSLDSSIYQSFVNSSSAAIVPFRKCLNAHSILKLLSNHSIGELQTIALGLPNYILSNCKINSRFLEMITDKIVADTQALRDVSNPFPRVISLDKVVSVNTKHVKNLSVYDVQTFSTLYQVNGLVSSNCRCAFLPEVTGEKEPGQKRSKSEIDKAFDKSISVDIPKGRKIKGKEGKQFKDPKTGKFTVPAKQGKRTLKQQKKVDPWQGADTKISKDRPKGILNKNELPKSITIKPKKEKE